MNNNEKNDVLLGQAIKNALSDDLDSTDFFKDIKYVEPNLPKNNVKRKPRYLFYSTIAASLLIICLLSGTIAVFISNDSVEAAEFTFEKQLVKISNIFSNDKTDNKKYISDDMIVQEITDLDNINSAKIFFQGLFIPGEVPVRFNFESLTVTKSDHDLFNATYIYNDNNGKILTVRQQSIPKDGFSMSIIGITQEIKTDEGTIYICEDPFKDGGNSVNYTTDEYSIDAAGSASVEELLKIVQQ